LRGIGHTIKSVIGSFSAVWADIELAGTFLAGGKGLNPFSEENRARLQAALEKRNAIVAQANQNYVDLWDMPLLADAVTRRFEDIRKGTEASNAVTQASTPRKRLNYSTATGAVTANAMAGIDSEIKRLQGQVDVESAILKDRQRIIDLYESQGYISFKEATEARLAAQEDFTERLRALTDEEEAILRRGLESVAKTTQDKLKLQDRLAEILLKRQRLEREAQQSNLERQIRLPGETMKDLAEQAARGQSELRVIEEQIKTLRETGAISELDSLRRLAAARRDSANQLAPGNEKLADALKKIEESARQAADGATLLNQRVKELADPEAGFAKGLRLVAEEAEQIGKQMESATVRAFNGMTDALVNFVMTGKLDFRSLANSIISDLIRIQIQRAITLPLARAMSSFFGFADGGVMTSAGPMALRTYASGGIANSPQLALFGEGSKPEAYVPLPDGRSIPVTMSGGASAGDVFNISVSVSDAGASSRGDDPGGRDLGRAIASAVRQELLAQKRAGGLLDGRRAV
jgi:lambda family phage tail tape measure protein